MLISENHSLKQSNTFGIDVLAKKYAEVYSEHDIKEFLKSKWKQHTKILMLGSGSNVLFTKNFDGLIIKNCIPGIEIIDESANNILLKSGAGVIWDDLVEFCVERNYWGIENLSLIPGTVGAAPIQNIGAYGVELTDVFHSLDGFFIDSIESKTFLKDELQFGYRESIFKNELKNKFIITNVTLCLSKKPLPQLNYRELKSLLEDKKKEDISISEIRNKVILIRRNKLPDTKKLGSAGSFFKNPVISEEQFLILKKQHPDVVYFQVKNNTYKLSAGWLIEKCGFKGKKHGHVGCYEKQALILINYGEATGKEILEFAKEIQRKVKNKFGVQLEPEVNIF